ncbi:MAG: hypothetical protein KDA45_07920 [Planctomycetales bacterium]|nr:hypothetical protein [Planctomycetales bacterium]
MRSIHSSLLLGLAVTLAMHSSLPAQSQHDGAPLRGAGSDARCCCLCGVKVCVLEVSTEVEEGNGFEVESKEVCIPGIRFPWDKCGPRRGGGVRKVCVLKEVKQEKTVCKYDWSIKTICTSCCRRHGLAHGRLVAEVHHDARVPFEYYAAKPMVDNSVEATDGKMLSAGAGSVESASGGSVFQLENAALPAIPRAAAPGNSSRRALR